MLLWGNAKVLSFEKTSFKDLVCGQGCRSLLSIGGDNSQFYPNFALFSTVGGINLDHDFVQVSKLSEDQQKNRSSPKMEHIFPKFKWTPTLRCTPESNYWGGCRCRPYLYYWGENSQIIGGDISPIPPGFATPVCSKPQ